MSNPVTASSMAEVLEADKHENGRKGRVYKEISDELGISVNTVENQMVTALKKLRVALKDYLPLLLFLVN